MALGKNGGITGHRWSDFPFPPVDGTGFPVFAIATRASGKRLSFRNWTGRCERSSLTTDLPLPKIRLD